jgi:hypothetical protein
MKCWNCNGIGLIPIIDKDGYYEDEVYAYGDQCPICQHGRIDFKKWLRHQTAMLNIYLNQKLARNIYPEWVKRFILYPVRNLVIITERSLK